MKSNRYVFAMVLFLGWFSYMAFILEPKMDTLAWAFLRCAY